MADIVIDRKQFDYYSQPVARRNVIAAIEALGFDASSIKEIRIDGYSVSGIAFVKDTDGRRNLASDGYLKFDFTAPIQGDEA